jgi:translation elongation factor EF-1alpha
MEKELGKVVHYFDKAMVAVIRLNGKLSLGDTVKFVHNDKETTQTISSMEIDRKPIKSGKEGEEVAVKVDEPTHEHAKVYKIE